VKEFTTSPAIVPAECARAASCRGSAPYPLAHKTLLPARYRPLVLAAGTHDHDDTGTLGGRRDKSAPAKRAAAGCCDPGQSRHRTTRSSAVTESDIPLLMAQNRTVMRRRESTTGVFR
jgi:hypothetical protein